MGMLTWRPKTTLPKPNSKQKKRSTNMSRISLQYLEQIIPTCSVKKLPVGINGVILPIDFKSNNLIRFEIEGIKTPDLLNQFLLSFAKKFVKKRPSFFFSPVRRASYNEKKNNYFPDEFMYNSDWLKDIKSSFEILDFFKYSEQDAEWTPYGAYIGTNNRYSSKATEQAELLEISTSSGTSYFTSKDGIKREVSDASIAIPNIVVFSNRGTVPKPMGVLSIEKYNEYSSKSFIRFTFKSQFIETDKGETTSSGIGKLLKRVKKDSTDEERFFSDLTSYLDSHVDLDSFFAINFHKDWLIYKNSIDDDTFKDSSNDPKSNPRRGECISDSKLAKLVIALAKRAMPDKMKDLEENSHGYTGQATETKFDIDNSVLNNIIRNWSYLQKQERVRDGNLKNFSKYFVYIPYGVNAKYGWLKLEYKLKEDGYGITRKESVSQTWLNEIDIESEEGINIGTIQASQDINDFVSEVSKQNRGTRSSAIFDHDNQVGIVPLSVCTFRSSYGLIVGSE
jgi:hypothetical protein